MQSTTEAIPAVNARLERLKHEAAIRFPSLWRNLLEEWNDSAGGDRLWLMYSANYLLRTGSLRWAIDPVRLVHRLPAAPDMDFAAALKDLSLVVLTHRHEDHLDLELIHSLRGLEAYWVVPEAILEQVQAAGVPASCIIVPRMLEPIRFQGLELTPFEGLHWEPRGESRHGVPAVGYLAEFHGKRWLFPGDTRDYDSSKIPAFGEPDALVAHLWLGRGCAQLEQPPLMEAFITFCLSLHPRRILLTHLDEFGREPSDLWEPHHADRLCQAFALLDPSIPVTPVLMGESARW